MNLEVIFNCVDCNSKVGKLKRTYKHKFEVSPRLLLEASIKNDSSSLPLPNGDGDFYKLMDNIGMSIYEAYGIASVEAKFKGWKLVLKRNTEDGIIHSKMKWMPMSEKNS